MGFFSFPWPWICNILNSHTQSCLFTRLCVPPFHLNFFKLVSLQKRKAYLGSGEQSLKVRGMGMLHLAELSLVHGGRPSCSSSACNGHAEAQMRPVWMFSMSHRFYCQTQIFSLINNVVSGNNSNKIQKPGAAGSQSSELAMPHLACPLSALLPSPSALPGVESRIPWSMENQVRHMEGPWGTWRPEGWVLVWGGQETVGRLRVLPWLSIRVLVDGSKGKEAQPMLTTC